MFSAFLGPLRRPKKGDIGKPDTWDQLHQGRRKMKPLEIFILVLAGSIGLVYFQTLWAGKEYSIMPEEAVEVPEMGSTVTLTSEADRLKLAKQLEAHFRAEWGEEYTDSDTERIKDFSLNDADSGDPFYLVAYQYELAYG